MSRPKSAAAAACDERLGHHDPTAPRLVPPLLHAAELDLKDSAHAARDGRERVLARLTPEDDDVAELRPQLDETAVVDAAAARAVLEAVDPALEIAARTARAAPLC